MTDEMMAERRRLFLEEMARIRDREQHLPEERQMLPIPASSCDRRVLTLSARPFVAPRPQTGPLVLMTLCLVLIFPIWGYIQRQAALSFSGSGLAVSGDPVPGSPEWRLARLQRIRAYFGFSALIAVDRDQSGYCFFFKHGLSHARLLVEARRIQSVLSGHTFPPRGPLAGRIGVCSGDTPCPISVIYRPGPGDLWYVIDSRSKTPQ